MDYNEIIKTLQEMESRFADGFSNLDRAFLDKMYYELFGKEITNRGCSDCYRDAYLEIMVKLRKEKAMPKKSDYKLKAGAVIQFFGESRAYTSANLTNEVAERYLSLNPGNANMFAELPDDWKSRVANFANRSADASASAPSMTQEEAMEIINSKNEQIASLETEVSKRDARIDELVKELETPSDPDTNPTDKDLEIENIRAELGEANKNLASVTAERDNLLKEVENLKKENKGLKQSNSMLKKKQETPAPADEKSE